MTIDRRWIFVAMGLALVVPLIMPLGLPTEASPPVKANFYTVDELPAGAPVLVSVDLDPASTPEVEPYFRASVRHLKKRGAKLYFVTLWYQAPPLVERWIAETVEAVTFPGDRVYRRNVDYVWLGFREGKQAVMANMGQDLWATFAGHAADGTALADIPLMSGVHKLSDFALLVLVSAGFPGAKEYVQQVQARYSLRMVAACTAVSTTDLSPYYASGQLLGLAGGMGATAEYEVMVSRLVGIDPKTGMGAKALDALNVGHVVVILAIVFGNVVYFAGRRRR
ncbi:MAG TPA: hypothetical protein VKE22_27720 [Haliangiales bacterium]|nr:hypothetical protein [Haliangiales bacterium]